MKKKTWIPLTAAAVLAVGPIVAIEANKASNWTVDQAVEQIQDEDLENDIHDKLPSLSDDTQAYQGEFSEDLEDIQDSQTDYQNKSADLGRELVANQLLHNYWLAKQSEDIQKRSLAQAEEELRIITLRYKEGISSRSEMIEAEISVNTSKAGLEDSIQQANSLKFQLNQDLGNNELRQNLHIDVPTFRQISAGMYQAESLYDSVKDDHASLDPIEVAIETYDDMAEDAKSLKVLGASQYEDQIDAIEEQLDQLDQVPPPGSGGPEVPEGETPTPPPGEGGETPVEPPGNGSEGGNSGGDGSEGGNSGGDGSEGGNSGGDGSEGGNSGGNGSEGGNSGGNGSEGGNSGGDGSEGGNSGGDGTEGGNSGGDGTEGDNSGGNTNPDPATGSGTASTLSFTPAQIGVAVPGALAALAPGDPPADGAPDIPTGPSQEQLDKQREQLEDQVNQLEDDLDDARDARDEAEEELEDLYTAQKEDSEVRLKQQLQALELQSYTYESRFIALTKKIEAQESNVEKANRLYEVSVESLEQGLIKPSDVEAARLNIAQVEMQLLSTQNEYMLLVVELRLFKEGYFPSAGAGGF